MKLYQPKLQVKFNYVFQMDKIHQTVWKEKRKQTESKLSNQIGLNKKHVKMNRIIENKTKLCKVEIR